MIVELMDNDNGYLVWLGKPRRRVRLELRKTPVSLIPRLTQGHFRDDQRVTGAWTPRTLTYRRFARTGWRNLPRGRDRLVSHLTAASATHLLRGSTDRRSWTSPSQTHHRALANRFQRIVPDGFHVWEAEGLLRYSADSRRSTEAAHRAATLPRISTTATRWTNESAGARSMCSGSLGLGGRNDDRAMARRPHDARCAREGRWTKAPSLVRRGRCARLGVREAD